jgi:DNA-binding MarR family transcriptional regulator
MNALSGEQAALYRALMSVAVALPRMMAADMTAECGLGISEYILLETLREAPGHRMRMTGLALACGMTASGITRVMNRLDGEGLTRRDTSPGDARGTMALLTMAGAARLEQALPAHLACVRRHVLDSVRDEDVACFASSMERIADSLRVAERQRNSRRQCRDDKTGPETAAG